MDEILVVHGTGGPRRGEASLRREWLTSMQDGLVLAGYLVPELTLSIVDLDERPATTGDGLDAGPLDWSPDSWPARTLAGWRAHAVYDAGEPACDAARPATVLAALGWSRYFAGLPAAELVGTLDALDRYTRGQPPAAARIRAALGPQTRLVLAFGMGGLAALDALHGYPGGVPALVTIGTPVGLLPAERRGPAVPAWWHLTDDGDTLVAASPDEPVTGRHEIRLDCDPRLRAPRNYLASPEFGQVLAQALATYSALR